MPGKTNSEEFDKGYDPKEAQRVLACHAQKLIEDFPGIKGDVERLLEMGKSPEDTLLIIGIIRGHEEGRKAEAFALCPQEDIVSFWRPAEDHEQYLSEKAKKRFDLECLAGGMMVFSYTAAKLFNDMQDAMQQIIIKY